MCRIILSILFATFAVAVSAQQPVSVSGRLFDEENREGVIGAVIEVVPAATPEKVRYYTSEYGGYFKIPALRAGSYRCVATFIGYEDRVFEFEVASLPLDVGTLAMKTSSIGIEAVVKEAVSTRTTMVGDTLRYNADAFKVATDAEVEALLRKMPGITISEGKIEAQGEVVKQIYVDGTEFFGGNIQQVLQSIPAQAVEHIEVYNRLSEAAQITGVDDGEGGKVINIVTRQSLSHSSFGKVHAGFGYEPDAAPGIAPKYKYTAGGSVNIFRGDARVTVMGLVNNLNKQNLTDDDMSVGNNSNNSKVSRQFTVNSQQGVAAAEIFALNYSDRWGQRKRAKFEGNIFYNHLNAKNGFTIDRWYNAPAKIDTAHYDQFANPDNYTLKFRGRLEWKVAKRQKLVIIPNATYTDNSSVNRVDTTSLRWGESGYRWLPSGNDGRSRYYMVSTYAQYSYKFLRQGRVFLLVASVNHSDSDADRNYYSNGAGKTSKKSPELATIGYTYSRKFTDTETTTIRIQPTYRDRIGRYSTINLSYRLQCQLRSRDLLSYATGEDYMIDDNASINTKTSSSFDGKFLYHQAGAGFRYSRNRNWVSLSASYQNSRLSNHNRWTGDRMLRSYHHPIYNATLQWSFNRSNMLRVSCNSEVKAPSLWTMLDIYDVSNSQYVSRGNPRLKPFAEHNFFARYTNISTSKGTTFMLMAKVRHIQDYIGVDVVYSPETIEIDGKKYNPIQLTMPVNLNGYWSYEGRASIGFPVKFLGSNLNISVGANYSNVPVVVNKSSDMMDNLTGYANLTLGSNISENVDFTIDWRGAYSTNKSALAVMNNDYFTHTALANVKVVMPLGFTLTTGATFTQYVGFTNRFNDCFTMWNIAVGKKVLRRLREVEFCVNDVLNQNTSFGRYVWAGYSQVRYNSTMGRYFLVKFTYNLRNFAGGSRRMRMESRRTAPTDRFGEIERKLNALKF